MELTPRAVTASLRTEVDEVYVTSDEFAMEPNWIFDSTPVAWRDTSSPATGPTFHIGLRLAYIGDGKFYADGMDVRFQLNRCEVSDPSRGLAHAAITDDGMETVIQHLRFEWGDGTYMEPMVPPFASTAVSHTYATAGEYVARAELVFHESAPSSGIVDYFAMQDALFVTKTFNLA